MAKPHASDPQIRLLSEQLIVAVVVQDPKAVAIGDRGNQQIDARKAGVTDSTKLALDRR